MILFLPRVKGCQKCFTCQKWPLMAELKFKLLEETFHRHVYFLLCHNTCYIAMIWYDMICRFPNTNIILTFLNTLSKSIVLICERWSTVSSLIRELHSIDVWMREDVWICLLLCCDQWWKPHGVTTSGCKDIPWKHLHIISKQTVVIEFLTFSLLNILGVHKPPVLSPCQNLCIFLAHNCLY